jgi:hypothetical protein
LNDASHVYVEDKINLDQLDVPNGAPGDNVVICCKIPTQTQGVYNYAKILFKRGNDGKFLQGESPDRYVECVVSYQKVTNTPYAR